MSDSEKRGMPRIPLKIEIGIHSETNFYTGFSVNISSGGIFIATHVPSNPGDIIPLSFNLPNSGRTIEANGVVRWYREYNPLYPETHPGMGVKFIDLSPDDQKIVNEYITNLREPYFHPEEEEL